MDKLDKMNKEEPKVETPVISVEMLKAKAYDVLSQIEYLQSVLRNLNGKISEMSKK